MTSKLIMLMYFKLAKDAKIGDMVTCPYCREKFVKRSKMQKFCCNYKTSKHSGNCKDSYWNEVNKKTYIKEKRLINPDYCNSKC